MRTKKKEEKREKHAKNFDRCTPNVSMASIETIFTYEIANQIRFSRLKIRTFSDAKLCVISGENRMFVVC